MSLIDTKTDSYTTDMLASGLAQQVSSEPLVALYKDPSLEHTYQLVIHVYIPDGVTPSLNPDFNDIKRQPTEAGELYMRQIFIDFPDPAPGVTTFSLWEIRAIYTVDGLGAEALRVKFVIGDPVTSRGTVTSVATT
jgi:hypothetical protein